MAYGKGLVLRIEAANPADELLDFAEHRRFADEGPLWVRADSTPRV